MSNLSITILSFIILASCLGIVVIVVNRIGKLISKTLYGKNRIDKLD
jgi:hypothetical protein